ncbi:hypothetical protein TNIN_124761 [Trichonephila inaurata madagascariensis]|uniref:Uncharacterized protein n=1 Tax=Trichonephila inaurata madagascariensis TaxID=2747483 RepID=A0A8X7BSD6_9ARAC|nr:hypothetical protein TNIN_124761 [Trichonephila inaurata madagascariensis]
MSESQGDLFNSTKKKGSLNLVLAFGELGYFDNIKAQHSVKSVLMSSTSVLMGSPLAKLLSAGVCDRLDNKVLFAFFRKEIGDVTMLIEAGHQAYFQSSRQFCVCWVGNFALFL